MHVGIFASASALLVAHPNRQLQLQLLGTLLILAVSVVSTWHGVRATRFVRQRLRSLSKPYWRAQLVPLLAGVVCAAAFSVVPYPVSPSARVVGFPMPAAGFEKHHGMWIDFVGTATPPLMLWDALIGLMVPQLVVAWRLRRRERATGDPS